MENLKAKVRLGHLGVDENNIKNDFKDGGREYVEGSQLLTAGFSYELL